MLFLGKSFMVLLLRIKTRLFYQQMHAFWSLQKKNDFRFVLGICSFLLGLVYLWLFCDESLLKPDSLGYINFSSQRSLGYPLFLKGIHFLFHSYEPIPSLQIFFFCFSAYFLSASFLQMTRSSLLSIILLFALLFNIPFAKLSFSLLTDSPAQSFLMMGLALTIKASQSKETKYYYGLCLVVGMAALIRPLSIILCLLPLGLSFFQGSSLKEKLSKQVIIGFFVIASFLLLGSTAQFFRHGFFKTEAFLGHNLIGKALIAIPTEDVLNSPFPNTRKESVAVQLVLNKAPSLHLKYLLTSPYYDTIRQRVSSETPSLPPSEQDDFWKKAAISLIKGSPKAYLGDIWMNYWALWQLGDLCTYQEDGDFKSYLETHTPLPIMGTYQEPEMRHKFNQKLGNPFIVYGIRMMLGLGFILSLLIPLLSLIYKFRKKPISNPLVLGTLSALTLQAGFIAIACTQAGLGRYALSFWPCLCILFLSTLTLFMDHKHK
ncbi:MAG: hypothetical protein A2621_01065 [Alphaproteobacteria bacterium RIFCSPHIGHO2_01_FULL_41_14]|nr:MAG: hypothetical protein A3K20_01725 [Alphaproteobacteria bacterium GWA1_45_9]OFW89500.1 MAG: hypothetical protein A2621_01065 [Alphaproteobacteria bacterium RIFCSPHIGHO2_01_FULL_41_14]